MRVLFIALCVLTFSVSAGLSLRSHKAGKGLKSVKQVVKHSQGTRASNGKRLSKDLHVVERVFKAEWLKVAE